MDNTEYLHSSEKAVPLLFKVQQTQNVTRVQKARVDAWNIPIYKAHAWKSE
jgi:hypothetical protein